ncbi:hypothetical protein SNE40_020443 [Patella caerulea]|uniref:Uncharacterized protein n=1 Tax=Patella caerulea TaxID=87958 RepID=A0AAN8G2T8_PATCE
MPLSAKERAQRYRDKKKATRESHEAYLQKERERWVTRKNNGKIKTIEDLSERGKRIQRKKWREVQRKVYAAKKTNKALEAFLSANSPPTSPVGIEQPIEHANRRRGRKIIRQRQSQTHRQLRKMQNELRGHVKLVNRYKKRLERLKNKSDNVHEQATRNQNVTQTTKSPRSKTAHLLKNSNTTSQVKRTLLFQHALVEELKER